MTGILLFFGVVGLLLLALTLLLTDYRVEVKPATAMVYNNQWTGRPGAFLPGTHIMIPFVERRLEEVTLRNEARNPSNVMLFTGDGIELEVDYIIRRQQIGYPSTDPVLRARFARDPRLLRERAVMAATAIDYKNRNDLIQTRIVAALQQELERHTYNELFPGADITKGEAGKLDERRKNEIEEAVNRELARDPVTQEWGFAIEMDLEDYDLPDRLRRARERKVSAQMEGTALREKAAAAGINPTVFVVADALSDIFRTAKDTKDKK